MDDAIKRAMLEELKESGLVEHEMRRPGDLDSKDIAQHMGVSERWAFDRIRKLAKDFPDRWEAVMVYDPGHRHQLLVLRKKESSAEAARQ